MPGILIAVPVLDRPQQALRVAESVAETTPSPCTLLFLCTHGDQAEIASCAATGASVEVVPWDPGPGDYARKINHAVTVSSEPWILMGADDLCFCPGWAEAAMRCADETGKRVIGTNDLNNPRVLRGEHSTHPLVHRSYIEEQGTIDEQGKMLHEGYDHNYCDDELVSTAKHRGEWVFCADCEIPHLHPDWGHSVTDATYTKGRARFTQDAGLYRIRQKLWHGH